MCDYGTYLSEGQCVKDCPDDSEVGDNAQSGSLNEDDFSEFQGSWDASKPLLVKDGDGKRQMYFGHGYGVAAQADVAKSFAGTMENLTDWTEIYVSSWTSEVCASDPYSTAGYCTGNKPNGDGGGSCCAHWGKEMRVGMKAGKASDGAEVAIYGGWATTVSGSIQDTGKFFCYNQEFGTRRSRYQFKNIDFTVHVYRDGTIECWLGHSILRQGVPTRAPDKVVKTGIALGPDLTKAYVQKAAGWAEGGGLAKDVAVIVKTATRWETGRTCVKKVVD
jgi:hypothetical protein